LKNLNIILLIISSIFLSLCISSTYALSPTFVRQDIIDDEDANLTESNLLGNKTSSTNLEDCKIRDNLTGNRLAPYGDITEVSYLSDGKFLNSTLWIKDYINLANATFPEGMDIVMLPNNENLDLRDLAIKYVKSKIREFIQRFDISKNTDLNLEDNTKSYKLGKDHGFEIVVNTTRNDPSKTEETYRWVIVEHNKKIYDFVFSSLSHRYQDLLDNVNEILNSTVFIDNHNKTSKYNSSRFHYHDNLKIGFVSPNNSKIDDHGNWITINFPTYDFQLISKSYVMLIDVNSIYDTGIDYIKRIWFDRLTNSWNETLYETKVWNETKLSERFQMMEGIVRTIEDKNFKNFPTNLLNKLERQDFYVPIPLNLQHLNYPNTYDIYFVTFSSYKVGNKTCNLIDTTSFAPIPPPKINITVIPHSLEIRPGEDKNFEIRIDPSTRLPYRISLEPEDKGIINAVFTSNKIPNTHKDIFITNFKISVPETMYFPKTEDSNFPKYDSLPINVTIFIEPSHKDKITNIFIKNKLFSNLTSTIYLPVKINPPLYPIDYLKSAAAEIASPLGTIMTTLGVVVGSIVGVSKWFLSQKKVKEDEKKDDIWY
jgi:hypothetical protein